MAAVSQWDTVYTDLQRDALAHAFLDRGIRSMAQVARLARAGELVFEGKQIPAFDIPNATARDIIRKAEQRRLGHSSKLSEKPPTDAVEILRRRLVAQLDAETDRIARAQKRKPSDPIDAEQIRKLARATRELAALPGPGDPRPPAPGATIPGQGRPQGEAPTKPGSIAGSLIAALDEPRTARDSPQHLANGHGDHAQPDNNTRTDTTTSEEHDQTGEDPGSYVRGQIAGLRAQGLIERPPA